MFHLNATMEEIRQEQFPSLKDNVYLDHAGTTLASKCQLDGFHGDMLSNLYGNPHSHSPSSQLTTDTIDQIRYRILHYFNTSPEDYSVIFTSGCTASLKLVAELFDFQGNDCCHGDKSDLIGNCQITANKCNRMRDKSTLISDADCSQEFRQKAYRENCSCSDGNQQHDNERSPEEKKGHMVSVHEGCTDCKRGSFTYLIDNHTSVQGMRQLILSRVGQVSCLGSGCHGNSLDKNVKVIYKHENFCPKGNHLFTYPAQSNYSGWKYPLEWIKLIQDQKLPWQPLLESQSEGHYHSNQRWCVLLDAAALVSTSALDLKAVKPDFVSLSFYKMFGFPTGLGALLVRNDAGPLLKKTYFGGGTVNVSLPTQLFHVSRSSLSESLEDGTVSFLDIISLRHGFHALENLAGGIRSISDHTFQLAKYFYDNLTSCFHGNGAILGEVYTYGDFQDPARQGAIVNFNLKRANGDYIGFATVDSLAQLHNIHVRTGCFCNIGACQHFLHMSDQQIQNNFAAGHVCGDNNDLIDGRPTGSVRVSFGYMSTIQDAKACLQFIVDCFLENTCKPVFKDTSDLNQSTSTLPTSHMSTSEARSAATKLISSIETPVSIVDFLEKTCKPVFKDTSVLNQSTNNNLPTSHMSTSEARSTATKLISTIEPSVQQNVESINKETTVVCTQEETADEDAVEEFASCSGKHLSDICLYPIKSCAAFKVSQWRLGERGLLYDREWMIITESGVAMSQKRERMLCLVQPTIDTQTGILTIDYPGMPSIEVSLDCEESAGSEVNMCNSRVCGDRVQGMDCGDSVGAWLSEALQRPGCRLIRQRSDDKRASNTKQAKQDGLRSPADGGGQLSLANVSQFLLVSRDSVSRLRTCMYASDDEAGSQMEETMENFDEDNLVDRFRGNLVISGCEAFEEDSWQSVQIGNIKFMSQGPCTRCQMVCMDQRTGQKSTEPLRTLQKWKERKTTFGVHLCVDSKWSQSDMELKVGYPIFPDTQELS